MSRRFFHHQADANHQISIAFDSVTSVTVDRNGCWGHTPDVLVSVSVVGLTHAFHLGGEIGENFLTQWKAWGLS